MAGQFKTHIGAVAAAAGSAVGLGNIWRFPYEMGQGGGGAFLFIYVLCVLLVGVPVMTAEFHIGKRTHQGPHESLRTLSPGTKWHHMSLLGIVAAVLILAFYAVVAGWILYYFYLAVSGQLVGHSTAEYSATFLTLTENRSECFFWTFLMLLLNHLVLRAGVERGVERASRTMMPLLFLILLIFAVRSLMLPCAQEGLNYMFKPSWEAFTPKVMIAALGQAFFSLSIGIFCAETYGSYFRDDTPLVRTSLQIAGLDTLVAVLAGIIIFPALFSFGGEVAAGPKLIFEVLPSVFGQMSGTYFWSTFFFLLLLFAALTSLIAMSEIVIASIEEAFPKLKRVEATTAVTLTGIALSAACAFFPAVFGIFEFTSSNLLMPLGGFFICWFVGWHLKEVNIPKLLLLLIRYVAPTCILIIFIAGLLG